MTKHEDVIPLVPLCIHLNRSSKFAVLFTTYTLVLSYILLAVLASLLSHPLTKQVVQHRLPIPIVPQSDNCVSILF